MLAAKCEYELAETTNVTIYCENCENLLFFLNSCKQFNAFLLGLKYLILVDVFEILYKFRRFH